MNAESNDKLPELITRISVTPIRPRDTLVAFCSCVYREELYLGDLALHVESSGNDYKICYPVKVLFNKSRSHIVFPLNSEISDLIKNAIVSKYEEIIR